MQILIKQARIFQPGASNHGSRLDVLLDAGKISAMEPALEAASAMIISGRDLWLSSAFTDTYAFLREPGYEYKETLQSGSEAAFRGGFTRVLVQPDTKPTIQTKGEVQALLSRQGAKVALMAAGAATEDLQGKHLTEMLDMHAVGAKAFSNADMPIDDSRVMLLALQYVQHADGLLMVLPMDSFLSKGGQVHEGLMSTRLGLRGIPALAEELRVARDLDLLAYTGGRLHFSKISSAGSLQRIRAAKAAGLQVSCGVAAYQLLLTDEQLPGFDTRYKSMPPLRDEMHRQALLDALRDGTIDVICSDHQPEDTEHKALEFDLANFGLAGLETALSAVVTAAGADDVLLEKCLAALITGPERLLGLTAQPLKVGQPAQLVVFDRAANYTIQPHYLASKGVNNPFVGSKLQGPIRLVTNELQNHIAHV